MKALIPGEMIEKNILPVTADNIAEKATVQTLWASFVP